MRHIIYLIIKSFSIFFLRKHKISDDLYSRVLVLCGAGIGDAIMATPIIRAIKKNNKKIKITIVSNNANVDVFKFNPYISKHIVYSNSYYSRLKACLSVLCNRCDVFIGTQPSNTTLHAIFAFMSLAKTKAKVNKENIDYAYLDYDFLYDILISNNKKRHRVQLNADIVHSVNLITHVSSNMKCEIFFNEKKKQVNLYPFKINYVCVHLGIGRKQKIWPIENYSKVINYLIDKNKTIVIVGGNEERNLISKMKINNYMKIVNLIGKLKLNELHVFLQHGALLLTNDTGVMHVAATTKIKILSLFGSTNPLHIGPYTDKAIVIAKNSINDILVEEVINIIDEILSE
ncbi:MAG: glycosyltransferase family 9 protein [Armatimonadetes bacterium]|nr:glycosyltransferase family 9 protein [Armatimonadota bacterium]